MRMLSPSLPRHLPKIWIYRIFLLGLFISASLGFISRIDSGPLAQWDKSLLDVYLKYSASGGVADNTVVIDIDDVSLSAIGQWPWPRYKVATLVQGIAEAKPAAIGLDILFPEPDRTSLNNIRQSFKHDFGLELTFSGAPDGLLDNDGYLGHVLSSTDVVGARYYYFDHQNKVEIASKPEFTFTGRTDLLQLKEAQGVLNNTFAIAARLKHHGFLNNQPDDDGLLRRVPLLMRHNGNVYPHLSLATFMRSLAVDSATIGADGNGPLIQVGQHTIPIDKAGDALLKFNGKPHLYPTISAVDVLNGGVDKARLAEKIVIVGSSAAALHDLHNTLFDSQLPGLKVQAAMVENMADNDFIRVPAWAGTAILLACIATGLIASALFIRLREPRQLLLGCLALAGLVMLVSLTLFHGKGLYVSPAAPLLTTAILFVSFMTARFAIEKRNATIWLRQLANARQITIESMAAVAETRDPDTGSHIKRTKYYVKAIAEKLRETGHYPDILTREYVDLLSLSAPLHDIGKVGVPDHILLKPDMLTPEEYTVMKKHAEYGKKIIHSTADKIDGDNFLAIAGEIASSHHEKWDGTGYPLGLAGQNIPLAGRIMIVGDVYDALISRRCYKPAFPHDHAINLMKKSRGSMFDPVVFDAFLGIEQEIQEIALRYQDEGELVLGDR